MRLIDADEALRLFDEEYEETKELIHNGETQLDSLAEGFTEAHHIIKYVLPTVDAVVVTRCKDCVHWDDDPDTYGTDDGPKGKCMKSFETMCADDFCSYGEPKESKNADDHD